MTTPIRRHILPLAHGALPSADLAAAQQQCALYRDVFRITAEVIPDSHGTPWVEMPVSASYSAASVPNPVARQALRDLDVGTIAYPDEHRVRILVFPDHLEPADRTVLDRLGITVAKYGSYVRLPITGIDGCFWIRRLSAPAYLPRLSEVASIAASYEKGAG